MKCWCRWPNTHGYRNELRHTKKSFRRAQVIARMRENNIYYSVHCTLIVKGLHNQENHRGNSQEEGLLPDRVHSMVLALVR